MQWYWTSPLFARLSPSYQPTRLMPPVPSFVFWSSARNLTTPALPVNYSFLPLQHDRDFHPLEKSAAKRTRKLRTKCTEFSSLIRFHFFEFFSKHWNYFEKISNNSIVCYLEDISFWVFINGNDDFRV